jgi:hypothetical protein
MAPQSNIGMKFKSSPGSMEAVGSGGEADDIQEDAEATTSKPKKKDNTLLFVGVAAIALMALKGR